MDTSHFEDLTAKIWASGTPREDLVQRVANALRELEEGGHVGAVGARRLDGLAQEPLRLLVLADRGASLRA